MSYSVTMVADKTWLIKEETSLNVNVYMYLLEGTQAALLIDAGYGSIPLRRIVEELTSRPVTVLLTHGHIDHIGGNADFNRVLLHEMDWECYQYETGKERRLRFGMDDTFSIPKKKPELIDGTWYMDLGERPIRIFHVPGHTPGSVCVLDESRRALYTGDSCNSRNLLLNMPHSCRIETYYQSISMLLEAQSAYDTVWPGHHIVPLGHDILLKYQTAVGMLLTGEEKGISAPGWGKIFYRITYQDIGIVYNLQT